jgi:protein SCO1
VASAQRAASSFVAVLMVLVLAGCGSSSESGAATGFTSSDHDGYHGILMKHDAYAVPGVTLTDTEGKPFDLAQQQRRTLVFFGYTNCPDICQVVMSTIASAMTRLSDAERQRLQVAFITTDPARDTRSALRTYLDRFDPSFVGVTGPLTRIEALAKPMDIFIKHGRKLPSGGYEVDHGTVVVAVEHAAGDLVWTAGTSPADMAEDLGKILAADS